MVNTCFVPGCKAGYSSEIKKLKQEGKRNPTLFKVPSGKVEEWGRLIPRKDTKLTEKCYVCERHFQDEDLERHWTHVGPDGKIILIEKASPILRPDANPRIFPNLPERFSKPTKKRKPPAHRDGTIPDKRKKKDSGQAEESPLPEEPQAEPDDPDRTDGNDLTSNLQEDTPVEDSVQAPTTTELTTSALYDIHSDATNVRLPGVMWGVHQDPQKKITVFTHLDSLLSADKCVKFENDSPPQMFIRGKKIEEERLCQSRPEAEKLIYDVDSWHLCPGAGGNLHAKKCSQYIPIRKKLLRCSSCNLLKRALARREKRASVAAMKMKPLKRLTQQKRRLKKKVDELQSKLQSLQAEYKNIEDSVVEKLIADLPPLQQEAIKTCVAAGKAKSPKGVRYSVDWVYECLLLRIKGPALYEKMRADKLLPLPSQSTLRNYIRKMKPQYGFDENLFQMMTEKSKHFDKSQRHGSILIDEMKLSKGVAFNKNTLEVDGLINLGDFTPKEQDGQMADHALVIMFQPFKGHWIQSVGAFTSTGATPGNILDKLALEAVILLEKAGFFVDEVVTDAASWNRSMWRLEGITRNRVSCQHPVREEGRLWFASDFPHLMKSCKGRVIKNGTLKTPDGLVQLKHWVKIVELDEKSSGIKRCVKLTRSHLEPSQFQVMNVNMAFTFFSGTVADVMETYKDEGHPDFQDAEPTIKFVRRMNRMAQIMNSRTPWDSLKSDKDSPGNKELEDFLKYLDDWEECCADQEGRFTRETELGLRVTLRGALELIDYLSQEVGFSYIMLRRINQDALEHFFGHVRQACGANQHPDPTQFIQVYRLLSCYSLIKPPRGSNVSGAEMLQSLLTLKESVGEHDGDKRADFEKKLDDILDDGDVESFTAVLDHDYEQSSSGDSSIDIVALSYFAGYVARRAKICSTPKSCNGCMESLLASPLSDPQEEDRLIELRSRGYLFVPSPALKNILYQLECAICEVKKNQTTGTIQKNIIFEVLEEVSNIKISARVGCVNHAHQLTKWVFDFFLKTRMIFTCKDFVKSMERAKKVQKTRAKQLKKNAKLI